jgi:membrane associated rhomboid family serine protease
MGLHDRQYYRDDSRMRYNWGGTTRSAVVTLIIINIAIYVIDAFTPGRDGSGGGLMRILALHSDLFQRPWNVWQLFTYGWAHAPLNSSTGIWHIFWNMFGLFIFGVPVEQKYGKAEFIRFYVLAIVFSGFVWVVARSFAAMPGSAIGASGAVTAVIILMALNFPYREVLLFGVVPIQMWILATVYVAIDLLGSFRSETDVAYVIHLGGAGFAALYYYLNWNFQRLDGLRRLIPTKRPKLRVHRPKEERLQDEADRVLDKIHRSGEASLTKGERKTLERYSKQMRDRRKPDE